MDSKKILQAVVILGCLMYFCGCRQECVTKKSDIRFPIIISSQSDRICNGDGTLDVRENGSALILATWNNKRTYGADGILVEYDDQSSIWPFYDIMASKTEKGRKSAGGTIALFFHFNNEEAAGIE